MLAGTPKQSYTRTEALRVAGVTERQLRSWEKQELVPHLEEFAFSDLIALRSLLRLHDNRVPVTRIRQAVRALREKLKGVSNPLTELKLISEGKRVAVLMDGQKMEAVSGQLLIDFDREELNSLLAFPGSRPPATRVNKQRAAEEWFEKGLELEQIGAPLPEIVEAYERAIELDPHSAGALVNLGTIYYHLQRWPDAERCYKDALAIDASYALAFFNLGNLYDEMGDRQNALVHYQSALRANPNYADAHYNAALIYQSQGDVMRAVRHWKVYLKLDPGSNWASIARRELDKLRRATVLDGLKIEEGP
jgi:tetratricopeptide (TPR) repeat protein